MTEEGHKRTMKWVVCPVRRPLISVTKVVEAGNEVFMNRKNPRIVNTKTGQVTKLKKQGGVYVLDIWIENGDVPADNEGFARPK